MKSYDSVLVARYLLSVASSKHINLNVTKVQKLLYIIYGYFLANNNHTIVSECPKAWPYGPVFPRTQKKVDYTNILPLESEEYYELRADIPLNEVLDKVIKNYAHFSASQLSEWSHQENGPWHKATQQVGFNWNTQIPDDFIESYFKEITV